MLRYFYESALHWEYEPNDDNSPPKDAISRVLQQHKLIGMENFFGYFFLWRYVLTKLHLPIPQIERIIPYTLSEWNCIKGGSNTIT